MRIPTPLAALALSVSLVSALGCDKASAGGPPGTDASHRGAPPPPPDTASAKPDACKGGGGEVKDVVSASYFPRRSGTFCINPDGETKAFGDRAPKPIDGICSMFDGGCELYRTHKVKRTVSVDYVDGGGSGGTVDAILSQFESADFAYAMFTHRVTSDEDPARPDMPKKADLQVPSAMGTGSLYAWKGQYLLELSYVNTNESGDEKKLKASAEKVLPQIAHGIVSVLPGPPQPPIAVQRLPAENLLPLGVGYLLGSALGVNGTGNGAVGYYRDGDKRYRVMMFAKDDADQAKDVLKTFAGKKGATEEKGVGEAGVRLMAQEEADGPKSEWVLSRKGRIVCGIGDEPFAVKPGGGTADHDKVSLSKDDKLKKLRAILDVASK